MPDNIMSFQEWAANPSYHGDYSDYVRAMKALQEQREEERIARAVEKALRTREDHRA